MKATGTYPLEGIKYFRPIGAILDFNCPQCGQKIIIDAGDDFIEYPEQEQVVDWIECDCGNDVSLNVKIFMSVEIEYNVLANGGTAVSQEAS